MLEEIVLCADLFMACEQFTGELMWVDVGCAKVLASRGEDAGGSS